MLIYKTTNLINGKSYVGQLSRNAPNYLGSGRYILGSIKKYGKENFQRETIARCYTKEQLNSLEKFYIDFFNTKVPNGYNLTDGGDGASCGELNIMKRPEVRKKCSDSNKETWKRPEIREKLRKPHSEEWKKNISEASRGKPATRGFTGKHHSEETKKKIGERPYIRTPEIKELQSKIMRGKNKNSKSEEHRKKISVALTGKLKSEEHRRKVSEGLKRYHALLAR